MINVMIIDDHPLVREGLEIMLSHRPRFTVATTVSSGEEAMTWCRKNGVPDIILCDVLMPKEDGFTVLGNLKSEFGDVKLIFLSGMPRKGDEARARQMGACGYMPKSADTNTLADMIAKVAEGLVDFATESYTNEKSPFSPKERETLKYLALGKTREEISIIMGCGIETTKTRVTEIRRKLDASNTIAAIARAYELGYLT